MIFPRCWFVGCSWGLLRLGFVGSSLAFYFSRWGFVLLTLVAPAFIAITQMWYRRLEQPVRLGSWYAMNGVVNMVSWPPFLDAHLPKP